MDIKFWATAALCAGPIMFFRGFRDFRIQRLIQNTPTSRIRSMAMGLVEINGTVLQRSSVRAPFSNQPCAYWEVNIAVRMSEKHAWTNVYRETSGQPFYVDDGTGIAMVYPKGSMCRVPTSAEEACVGAMLPDIYSEFISERRIWQAFFWRASQMRFREHRVEEGEKVYVLGSAEPRPQSRDISNVELSELPMAAALADANLPLQATGTDGPAIDAPVVPPGPRPGGNRDVLAGTVIAAGAAQHLGPGALMVGAARDMIQARRRAVSAGSTAYGPDRVRTLHQQVVAVIRCGRNDPTFLISRESEEMLTTTLGLRTIGQLIAGPLMTVFGLWYWLTILGPAMGSR